MPGVSDDDIFVEIRRPEEASQPTLVEAYVAIIQPQQCGRLIKHLSHELPLAALERNSDNPSKKALLDLSHLKRVKRIESNTTNTNHDDRPDTLSVGENSPNKKKQKTEIRKPMHLEVLLRETEYLERYWKEKIKPTDRSSAIEILQEVFNLSCIEKRTIPGRPPGSHEEWQRFQNHYWPTSFFAEKTKEYLDKQLEITQAEKEQMMLGMEQAIQDALEISSDDNSGTGAVIMDPASSKVVATAARERELQLRQSTVSVLSNPLATSVLLAIQGVSRMERQIAISAGMGSSEFQKGQYLCTGYDLYTTHEPTVFEAMALVHSRIRRVVFGRHHCSGGLAKLHIHDLPSTNHHYRAFGCRPDSILWNKCKQMR